MLRDFHLLICFIFTLLLTSCSYNPFLGNNHSTGNANAALIGAGIGAGGVGVLGGSKSLMALVGVGGGAVGYYSSTVSFAASPLVASGGNIYTLGDFVGLSI